MPDQFGIIDTIISRLKLFDAPPPRGCGENAICPLVRVQVTGCPTIHLPFLSPEEVDDYDRKVEAGVIHPPITVEESYLTGGNFVFNRGKSYLFLSGPKGFDRNVHASRTRHDRDGIFGGSRNQGRPEGIFKCSRNQGKSRGSSSIPADSFEFRKSSLGARGHEFNEDEVCVGDSELEEIRKFVLESHHSNLEDCTDKENDIKTAIDIHAKVPFTLKVQDELVRQYISLRKPQLLNDLGSSYDSENLFDQVQSALRPEEVPTQSGTIGIRIELLDVLRFPPVVIATYAQRKSPPSPTKQTKRDAKTKPLLKEDIELVGPSGIPLGIIGIAITVQLFGEARTIQGLENQTLRRCSINERDSATLDEMWFDVQNLRKKVSMRKVISRMIHASNSLWGTKILFENPYMVKLGAEPLLQNVTNHEYKKILIGRLTCYLEPNYKHDPGLTESSSASESVSITFRSRGMKNGSRHEHHKLKTRKKESHGSRSASYHGSSIDDSESQSLAYSDERSDRSSTRHKDKTKERHRKAWPVRNARQPRGWLRSTPVTKRNRNIGGIKLPLVKLNRASFLRNVSSDPELDKQMQREIEKKLKEREKGDVTHTIMTRRVQSVRSVGYQVGSQNQYRCSSQQTDFLERIDEEIMVGESLQSARTSTKGSEEIEIAKSRPKPLEGNFIKSTAPLNDSGYSLSKRRESMEPIINLPVPSSYGSSRTEYQPVPSSYGSSRTEYQPVPSSSGSSHPEYQKEYMTSQITRDSDFGKTFTISHGYPADNIHNASELDKSSTIGSGLSKVYTKQDRLLSGSVGSFNTSESRDRRASFSQIEEQTEDGESSIGYAEDFEEVLVSDSSISEEITEEGETTKNEACINPRVLRTNVSKALTQLQKLEKVELASKNSKMLTERNDPRILKTYPSEALTQLQKLEKVKLDSNNSKMLNGRENPVLEQPIQILGSSGTYSMGELLLTQDPLFNASDTYSLGQIIENLSGIDYTRDSPCSSSLSEDTVSSGVQSESDQILTVKVARRSAFNKQSRGEMSSTYENETVPVVREHELDKSIVQYLDRYTSRQNPVIPTSKSGISGEKQQVEHFNVATSNNRKAKDEIQFAGRTNERKVKNQKELVSKNDERKARQSVQASARETGKPKNDFPLEGRGSPAYQLGKFPQETLISSSKNFSLANRENEAQVEKLSKQSGSQVHSASIQKALGPDESKDLEQCRRSDSQDPNNSKTLTGREGPKEKETQNVGKFDPKPHNQDEEDTVSDISAKIEALCSSSVLDKLPQHQTARRLSSVSSYVPSDDGSVDDLFGLDEEEFIFQLERELGMAGDPF